MKEIILSRPPKWVMCGVCGDVIWGGPGFHPIPRECTCRATRVVPREDRGFVQWNAQMYQDAAKEQALLAVRKSVLNIATEAARRAEAMGAAEEDIKLAYSQAREEAEARMGPVYEAELNGAPREPEVEYMAEGEEYVAQPPVAAPTTIADIYKKHWADIERQ